MFPTIRTLNLDMAGRLMILEDVLPQFVSFLHFDHFEALDTAVGVEVSMTLIEVVVQIHLVDVTLSANGARHWDFNLVFGQGAEQCSVGLKVCSGELLSMYSNQTYSYAPQAFSQL